MTETFHESNIDWTFDKGWTVIRYDESVWYRRHFQECAGSSAVDFVALDDRGIIVWFIEVKDFTKEPPLRSKDLVDIITRKVRDTLAGALAGSTNAGTEAEKDFFVRLSAKQRLRVAFHCERPRHKSKLFKTLPEPADLMQKLRKSLRAIDKRVVVLDCSSDLSAYPWTATWNPNTGAKP